MTVRLLASSLALGLSAGSLISCRPARSSAATVPAGEAPIPVVLAPVRDTLIARVIRAPGTLGAKEEVPLGFKIGGVIARIDVDAGERVGGGEVLAVLAEQEVSAEVEKAEAGLSQAERDYARADALYRDSVISRDRLESAGTARDVAAANRRIARFNETYAVIRSPAAGTVLRRLAEPGQQIAAGAPVLLLGSAARGEVVRVGLADRDVARVRIGDSALVDFTPEPPVRGWVSRVAAAATALTGAWEVEVALPPGRPLRSGLIGRVEITPREVLRAKLVPLAAILEGDGDSAVVYSATRRLGDTGVETARRHVVHIAFMDSEWAAIPEGLDGVTELVTSGAGYLHDGAAIAPVRGRWP